MEASQRFGSWKLVKCLEKKSHYLIRMSSTP
jgi:hypothetical protein